MKHSETVFIVDDDASVRDALSLLFEQEEITVKTFDSAAKLLAEVVQPEPRCCAIVDIRMPDMDGMTLQAELSRRGIMLPIIFLTGHGDIPMSVRAIKAGAIDFLTKPVTSHDLLASVHGALLESERIHAKYKANDEAQACIRCLTEREHEIMRLVIEGLSNKEIGRRLGISYRTVEIHRSHIMQKTGAGSVLDLARIAAEAADTPAL
jgi:FixJ family two-component response regulator